MVLIDTHTHLYDEQLLTDDQQISRAIAAGVHRMYMPNCDSGTIPPMLQLADKYPQHCLPMMGVHPCYVKDNYQQELDTVTEWLSKRKFAAVGEIGLDYHYNQSPKEEQLVAFREQMQIAAEVGLPVEIHTRDADEDTIKILQEFEGKVKGIIHCFTGTPYLATEALKVGYNISISGVVTFKNADGCFKVDN
jgi:TatD DNase family protein